MTERHAALRRSVAARRALNPFRYREALDCAQQALRGQPGYLTAVRLGAASSAMIGEREAARQWVATLRQIDPALRVSTRRALPFRQAEHLSRYEAGRRKAGLPD